MPRIPARRSRPVATSDPDPVRPAVAATIVAAVDQLVRERGWSATTMSDVAAAAGVSRQTVYNEFGSRPALVRAYVLREIETLVASAEEAVRASIGDARGALQAAFTQFLKLASDEPLVKVIVADADGGELVTLLTQLGRSVAVERVGALIVEVWPQVSARDAELLADSLARLAISHALLPMAAPRQIAADVTRLIGPFVDEIVGDASSPCRR